MIKRSVHITLGGRKLKLTVPEEEEESVRQAAKGINQIYQNYLEHYPEASPTDLFAMTALDVAKELYNIRLHELEPIYRALEKLKESLPVSKKSQDPAE